MLPVDFVLEGGTSAAALDVSAQLAALRHVSGGRGEGLSDLPAGPIPGPAAAPERLTGLEDERLDLLSTYPERRADLSMRLIAQLEQDERSALIGREAADVVDQFTQLLGALELDCRLVLGMSGQIERQRASAGSHDRKAVIASDRVQPRPQGDVLAAPAHRSISGRERQLQDVFGLISTPQDADAKGQHLARKPVVDHLEGRAVARPDLADELLVGHAGQDPALRPLAEVYESGRGPHR
jgi:hypothetical protein